MDLGRKVAMHVAATKPLAATTAELDPAVVEREKQILTEQAAEVGQAGQRHREDGRGPDPQVL